MAKSRANPVRARSPPDISDTACRRLPRGCAISSTPVSRGSPPSSASTSRSSARPPSKRRWKISPKWRLIFPQRPAEPARAPRRPRLVMGDGGARGRQPALPAAQVALDRRQLIEQRLVALAGAARLRLEPVALERHVARVRIRALPFLAQPLAPLAELGLP